jgi:uncharacterized membrane protein YuzA (DUF378 family)
MFKNVGISDRFLRLGTAGLLIYLGLGVFKHTLLGHILAVLAIIPALTSLVGFCGLYRFFNIDTSD